jgi:very-short-patch-repair endonuclease/predicted transcriptional regulator of viral defense system
MTSDPPVKQPKSPRRSALSGHKHLPDAYVPKVIALEAISGLVHSGLARDLIVAWIADRQLGLITAAQLRRAGVGRGSIEWRLANGLLHRVFRGVYLVGHGVPVAGAIEFAAVLAVGDGTLVSHRSAAALWGLARRPIGEVEVTVVSRDCRSRDGLRVHQVEQLAAADRAHKSGIPVASPARALVDYAATANSGEIERAMAEAYANKLTDERRILAAIERAPNHAGVALLRAILGQAGGPRRTRSGGERAMLKLIRAAGLPAPRTNVAIAGFTADFVWPEERLIVEVDGYPFHAHRAAFERDHRRDIVHKNAGYEVLRFTARQLDEEPLLVAAAIARALDRRSRG